MKNLLTKEEYTEIKYYWYANPIIQDLLLEQFCFESKPNTFRDIAILSNNKLNKVAFRGMTFTEMDYFNKSFLNKKFPNQFLGNESNLYITVARIYRIPTFSYGKERQKQTSEFYKIFKQYIYKYDIFLDFDIDTNKNSNFTKIINDIKFILDIIMQYKLKSEIVFSGNRGFKILIYNDFYDFDEIINIRTNLSIKFKLDTLDNSGLFFPSKLMKANFSLTFNKNNNFIGVVLPLNYIDSEIFIVLNKIQKDRSFNMFNYENFLFRKPKEYILNDNILNSTDNLNKFVTDFKLLRKEK